MKLSTK